MDAYPPLYTEHNLPLVLLSGLGEREDAGHQLDIPRQESGARINGETPESRTEPAERLLDEVLALDGSNHAWNSGALPGPSSGIKYKMKTIGRVGMLHLYSTRLRSCADCKVVVHPTS